MLSPATLTLTAANESGVATITLTVSDGTASAQLAFALTVAPVNDAPAFLSLPPLVSTTAGQPATFTVTLTDPDTSGSASRSASRATTRLYCRSPEFSSCQCRRPQLRGTFQVTLTPALGQTGTSAADLHGQ